MNILKSIIFLYFHLCLAINSFSQADSLSVVKPIKFIERYQFTADSNDSIFVGYYKFEDGELKESYSQLFWCNCLYDHVGNCSYLFYNESYSFDPKNNILIVTNRTRKYNPFLSKFIFNGDRLFRRLIKTNNFKFINNEIGLYDSLGYRVDIITVDKKNKSSIENSIELLLSQNYEDDTLRFFNPNFFILNKINSLKVGEEIKFNNVHGEIEVFKLLSNELLIDETRDPTLIYLHFQEKYFIHRD